MASTQLGTGDTALQITQGRNLAIAGSRLYAVWENGTELVYSYSDDNGATWTGTTQVAAVQARAASCFYDSVNGRLNIVYAGNDDSIHPLRMRAITSNVTSGTPGSLTTETTIDAGGANAGVIYPYALHSPGGTTPRYWIVATKFTTSSDFPETRAWFCNAGSAADTAGNWSTTNFTDIGANRNGNGSNHIACGAYWTISGNPRVTFVFWDGGQNTADVQMTCEAVTFDPGATTPTPGTVTVISTTQTTDKWPTFYTEGGPLAIAAKADYLVLGATDGDAAGTWSFHKTVNGTTWTEPSGWVDLSMGRAQLTLSGSDFFVLHNASYGAMATTSQALYSRRITAASDAMGSPTLYSDANGNGVTVPIDTGSTLLRALYRSSTAAPYSVRSDAVALVNPQTLLPDADVAAGGWATSPLWSKVNDSSDATVITATAS